jgi:hypothetical protein
VTQDGDNLAGRRNSKIAANDREIGRPLGDRRSALCRPSLRDDDAQANGRALAGKLLGERLHDAHVFPAGRADRDGERRWLVGEIERRGGDTRDQQHARGNQQRELSPPRQADLAMHAKIGRLVGRVHRSDPVRGLGGGPTPDV